MDYCRPAWICESFRSMLMGEDLIPPDSHLPSSLPIGYRMHDRITSRLSRLCQATEKTGGECGCQLQSILASHGPSSVVCLQLGSRGFTGWSDASLSDDNDTGRSAYGFVFRLGHGFITWTYRPLTLVAQSTTEVLILVVKKGFTLGS